MTSTNRFGWSNKKRSLTTSHHHHHPPQHQQPIRSAYFPDDEDDDDDTSSCWSVAEQPRIDTVKATAAASAKAGDTKAKAPTKAAAAANDPSSFASVESTSSAGAASNRKKILLHLDHLRYYQPINGREESGGGMADVEEAKADGGGEDEEEKDGATPSPTGRKKKGATTKGEKTIERIYFGDVRFPASRSVLWPRQAIGDAIFASSPDTTAPLLLLRTGPLRALHARLCAAATEESSSNKSYLPRGTLLKTRACPTASIRNFPPSLARTLLRPPPLTLVVQEEKEDEIQPLLQAASIAELMPELLDRSLQGSSVSSSHTEGDDEEAPTRREDPWGILLPVIDVADAAATTAASQGGPMSEADYRAIMTWATALLSHPLRGALPLAAAIAPMRLLVSATGPDTLHVRAERILLSLSIRFTPLEPLPALNTSLWSRLMDRPQPPSDVGPKTGFLTLSDTRRVVALLSTDPLVQERPLVGIWVTGLGDDWHRDVHRHPLLWAAVLRYVLSEDLGERVTVEPHTLLIAYFDSRPSSPPLFVESKLLWPSLPTVPGQPQPLAYRIFDFSADVSWEVETPTSGRRRHRGPSQVDADDWLNLVVGHFRETSCPPIASAFYRAQSKGGGGATAPTGMEAERETISALTFESRLVSPYVIGGSATTSSKRRSPVRPSPAKTSSPSPPSTRQQRQQQQSRGGGGVEDKRKGGGVTEGKEVQEEEEVDEEEEQGSAFSVRSAAGLEMPRFSEGEQQQQQAAAAAAYRASAATQQLILAQQQHLHQLQCHVRELESRLARVSMGPEMLSVSVATPEEWAAALPPLPAPSTIRSPPAAAEAEGLVVASAKDEEGEGGESRGGETKPSAKESHERKAEGDDEGEDEEEELEEVPMLKAPSWERNPPPPPPTTPLPRSSLFSSLSGLHAEPEAKSQPRHPIPDRLPHLSAAGGGAKQERAMEVAASTPTRRSRGGEDYKHDTYAPSSPSSLVSSPSKRSNRNAEELGLPTIEPPQAKGGEEEDEWTQMLGEEEEACLSKTQTTLALDVPRILYDLPEYEGGGLGGGEGGGEGQQEEEEENEYDEWLETESLIQIEARYLKMMQQQQERYQQAK